MCQLSLALNLSTFVLPINRLGALLNVCGMTRTPFESPLEPFESPES